MNTHDSSTDELLAQRAVAAFSVPHTVRVSCRGGLLLASCGGRTERFKVQTVRRVTPALVGRLAHAAGQRTAVLAQHVPPGPAESLRRAGIPFLDTAGNAFLPVAGLYVFVTGRPRPRDLHRPGETRLLKVAGLKVLFVLLNANADRNHGKLPAGYREIAAAAGVSLGSVSHVRQDLVGAGILDDAADDFSRLLPTADLFERWALSYRERLRPRLICGRYRAADAQWWRHAALDPEVALWSGEVAAARLTGSLKPETVTLYRRGSINRLLVEHALVPAQDGPVEIVDAFWRASWLRQEDCVMPLLVYADLAAMDDERCVEAGKEVYERCLRAFENAGG